MSYCRYTMENMESMTWLVYILLASRSVNWEIFLLNRPLVSFSPMHNSNCIGRLHDQQETRQRILACT